MGDIIIGGIGLFKGRTKHFKTLNDCSHDLRSGDHIFFKRHINNLTHGFPISQNLVIQGEGVESTEINVLKGSKGFILDDNSNVIFKDLTIVVPEQSNGIVTEPTFSGVLTLDNVVIKHSDMFSKYNYYPFIVSPLSTANGYVISKCKIVISNSKIDFCSLSCKELQASEANVGTLLLKTSVIRATQITAHNSKFSNIDLVSLDFHGKPGNAQLDDVSTYGRLSLSGKIVMNDLSVFNYPNVDDPRAIKKLHRQIIASRLLGETLSDKEAKMKLKKRCVFTALNIYNYVGNTHPTNIVFNNLNVAPTLSYKEVNPVYQLRLVNNQEGNITFKDITIPKLSLYNATKGGSIVFDNTVDKSVKWIFKDTTISSKGHSSSPLFTAVKSANKKASAVTGGSNNSGSFGAIAQLDSMVGLTKAKQQVKEIIANAKLKKLYADKGIEFDKSSSNHMVFAGSAGTGKTTVARIVAQALYENGVLPQHKFVDVQGLDLMGAYVGQTKEVAMKVINKAMGGVLLIDEAYALAPDSSGSSNNSFKEEAVDTLIKQMEDHRDDLIVIMAGYTTDMQDFFRRGNQGLKSRFSNWVMFDDYSLSELIQIFDYQFKNSLGGLIWDNKQTHLLAVDGIKQLAPKFGSNGGNGRFVRNYLEAITKAQNLRLLTQYDEKNLTSDILKTITSDDVRSGIKKQQANLKAMN